MLKPDDCPAAVALKTPGPFSDTRILMLGSAHHMLLWSICKCLMSGLFNTGHQWKPQLSWGNLYGAKVIDPQGSELLQPGVLASEKKAKIWGPPPLRSQMTQKMRLHQPPSLTPDGLEETGAQVEEAVRGRARDYSWCAEPPFSGPKVTGLSPARLHRSTDTKFCLENV